MAQGTTTTDHRARSRTTRCRSCGTPAAKGCSCDDAKVPCGCGALKCLCRPNWVAGMVLREEDLRRLDSYIIERFRRINLSMAGPGVVSGLEVRCDPCGDGVVVGCGQAISPCGDDIVVCDDAYVDICALVRACRKQERADCLPHERPRACPEVEEKWVLAVEYVERPARGMLPLRAEPKGCGCDASGDCGCKDDCGCDGTVHKPDRPRGAPAACQPTLLCEDVRFRVCPPPDMPDACRSGRDDFNNRDDPDRGPLIDRMMCCIDALVQGLPPVPQTNSTGDVVQQSEDWYRWICLIKRHLLGFASRYPVANCDALGDLQRLVCLRASDFQSSQAYAAWLQETVATIAVIVFEMMFACLCSALLPPCPEPATSTSIPIATVTVSYAGGGCRVVSICNWTRLRKYSANLRNLEYWLSIFPFGREFRRLLECLCCDLLSGLFDDDRIPGATAPQGDTVVGADITADINLEETPIGAARMRERLDRRLRPEAVGSDFDRLAQTLLRSNTRSGPIEPLAALMELAGQSGSDGPFGGSVREAPAETLVMSSVLGPILSGAARSPAFEGLFGAGEKKTSTGTDDIAALRAEIATLTKRLDGIDHS